ncbi:ABC transporter permease [Skermanella stibiiresistens SB22]|uniref:ABC transporter permease n=1 Tax=Skermanella stibiiresistens SB22 TaxID=1385369 RepID=W9HCT0_9PROT|nr:amino acid ABC transporter permease [Skermanella stibiiresistens]EWY41673.1 ABC transporter permease [Skermanella stibiiresistens SB22]
MAYEFDFSFLADHWPRLLQGLWLTLAMSGLSTVLGFLIGVTGAIASRYGSPAARRVAYVYVEVVRNTPLLVQVFLLYFGLSSIGLRLPVFATAVIALSINIGAYSTEIIRAGIESIAPGQIEAAECLGMSQSQIILRIVLQPALERVFPALTSQYVLLMLATSVTSQISAEELTGIGNLIQSETFRSFEVYGIVALCYIALSLVVRAGLFGFGLLAFPRRRRLGTDL